MPDPPEHESARDECKRGSYDHFRDPLGLVLRMLRSRNRAARAALVRAGLAGFTCPLDLALQLAERRRLGEAGESSWPMILVVGAPRSGTTLAYQVLARYLDVSYFTNLSALFPRAPLTATHLFRRFQRPGRADFQNYYGQTAGLSGPNDGFHIWDRWLGADRHKGQKSLDQTTRDDMRSFFHAWTATFEKPLLNKNNRNTDCAALLASVLPNAYFVAVERDPLFVVQSLITARQVIQGRPTYGWGLGSVQRESTHHEPLGYVDDVCDQVLGVGADLNRQRAEIPPERFLSIAYERLCADPWGVVRQVAQAIPLVRVNEVAMKTELKPFTVCDRIELADAELQRVRARLGDWSEAGSVLASAATGDGDFQ